MIYLDNASTTYPKPTVLSSALKRYFEEPSISPHRNSGSLFRTTEEEIRLARERLAMFLGVSNADQISFTYNASYAINMLLHGLLEEGDHVIVSSFEHNATRRPLCFLSKQRKITFDIWDVSASGEVDLEVFERLIRRETKLIFLNHASNVLGNILPIEKIAEVARRKGILLGLDATQTVGSVPFQAEDWGVDVLAGTGHKALLGPTGIGFLYVRDSSLVRSCISGGGGFNAMAESPPQVGASKFEPGTLNYLGIFGLSASMSYLWENRFSIWRKQGNMLRDLIHSLAKMPQISLYGTEDLSCRVPILSFNVRGLFPGQVERQLAENHGIIVRAGLHCAPWAHRSLGTLPGGTVRVSLGPFNTNEDVNRLTEALEKLCVKAN